MSCSEKAEDGSRKKKGGPTAAPFLVKTHQMVEEGETDDVISWGAAGKSFVVWKPMEFARDLLPANFKHNNFSSFVRQLNTYGFRKVVPDRWEFANDKFQQGEQRLLNEIRRRKAPPTPNTADKSSKRVSKNPTTPVPSTSNSGDLHASSSTSSPAPPQPSQSYLDLSNENKKLMKDNRALSAELVQAKKQCEQLLSFLSKHVDVDELNASLVMEEAARQGVAISEAKDYDAGTEEEGEEVECLKLFGVLLKGFEKKKRGRCEERSNDRPMKMGLRAPWMQLASPARESSKVCN